MDDMPPTVHGFDWPDRFVIDTVGEPGARTFFLQARTGSDVVSVALEKQQSAVLADKIEEILDQLMAEDGNPYSIPALAPDVLIDHDPLDEPVLEQFRAGAMSLGWDPSTAQIVIEAYPVSEADAEAMESLDPVELEPDEVLQVRIPVGAARAFAKRTREIIGSGRPTCSLCGEPMDSAVDHVCTLPDGFR